MSLGKYEDFLELFIKQSSPISLGQIMRCGKNQTILLVVKIARYFCNEQEL